MGAAEPDPVASLLARRGVTPVLVDVGASGGPPEDWASIARQSHYIGFDPDLREIRDEHGGAYLRSTMVAEAVTSASDASEVTFHLTSSPFCSSVLEPDRESLDSWIFHPLFEVIRKVSVPATTLDRVLDDLGLSAVDWLKLDTQGTDLRIVQSLSGERSMHLLAVDVEPGLIDAYLGEDLFVEVHRAMVASGFWLSGVNVQGAVRVHRSTVEALSREDPALLGLVAARARTSPGWCEARYLRRVDSLDWSSERDPLLLWTFSLVDGQVGAALDLCMEWRRRSGTSALLEEMVRITSTVLVPSRSEVLLEKVRRRVPAPVQRLIRRAVPRS